MTAALFTARPIAHRGLHDKARDVMENTAGAALAAIAHDFAIECDVQLTRDGEAVVFHDFALERLTKGEGLVAAQDAAALARIGFRQGAGGILKLADFLALIGGRVPLVCEVKSRFDGDMRLAVRTLAVVTAQSGPVAIKSFDPAVIAHLRMLKAPVPLGIVAEAHFTHPDWAWMPAELKTRLTHFLHYDETRPDFLSWQVADFPDAVPFLCRSGLKLPVMTWTVRTDDQRAVAAQWADQMVFEGFVP